MKPWVCGNIEDHQARYYLLEMKIGIRIDALSLYGGEFFKPRIKQLTLIIFGPPIVWAKNEKKVLFFEIQNAFSIHLIFD